MELSILIPSRNEVFLKNTIEDIVKNRRRDTEVIVVLDGEWSDPPIPQYDNVNIIYVNKAIGQRAATNLAAKLSTAKYVMKVDAHCSFDEGFDGKMLDGFAKFGENNTMVPIMRNLHVFNWKCTKCGNEWYQGPTPTFCCKDNVGKVRNDDCSSTGFVREVKWIGKHNPQSASFSFDSEPHFKYFEDYKHRPQYIKDKKLHQCTETMSLQGSCFMCTRENYWKLRLCDEELGNWGNQGIEVAVKTWLSGNRVLCNHTTWYSHMFRTQGGDFGFPWPNSGHETQRTKANVRKVVWKSQLPHQKYKLSWLLEKFWPVPGWTDEDLKQLKDKE